MSLRTVVFLPLLALLAFAQEDSPAAPAKKPAPKKTVAKKPVAKPSAARRTPDPACPDVPRIIARKRPVKKQDLSEAASAELAGTSLGVSLTDALELNLDLEAKNEKSADQLEKLVRMLTAAQAIKERSGNVIPIDLGKATRLNKNGTTVRATIALSDAELEKLLEARYGQKLVSRAKAMLIYVHGLPGGTKTFPFESASTR